MTNEPDYNLGDHYDLSAEGLADMIADIGYTLTVGDDNKIHLSNLAGSVLEAHGIDLDALGRAMDEIATRWRAGERI